MRRLRISSITVALVGSLVLTGAAAHVSQLHGGEAVSEFGTPTQEYLDQVAALEKMVTSRDTDIYELGFEPLVMDEISLKDKSGNLTVYSYLTFRLRNEFKDPTKPPMGKPSRYSEVLKAITEQYQVAKAKDGQLSIEGVEGPAGVILKRDDEYKPRTRKPTINVIAYNEHGTRIQLLDEPVGSGVQNNFNFADHGELARDTVYTRVREEIEEIANRRLLTVGELRNKELPPYDPTKRNEEGVAEGEAFGVVIFNRLSVYGKKITLEVNGLSNKFRLRAPEMKPGEVTNYVAARYVRRVYVLHYDRTGDEYFRNLDDYVLNKGGWEWVNTYQRLHNRKTMAYAKYFIDNITDAKGVRQPSVEEEQWKYYEDVRKANPTAGDKLPDFKAALKER
jgi:hypothetical protein